MHLQNWLQVVLREDWENGGFGLYVHWPFCTAKCPYCDFNSHVAQNIDHKAWAKAYLSELGRVATDVPHRTLNSIFFGGGTPSLMDPDTVARIIEKARQLWPTSNDMEITLEANPGSVEAGKFRAFRDAGVNRISMGVQALNDKDLKRLGRIHTVRDAFAAFDIARDTFERVSFDLIYARQDQSLADWRKELTQALSMAVDHLSLYQLTIEQGTAFGDRYAAGKLRGLPNDDLGADMFEATQELCDAAGLPAYEVSNHAKSGSESRHNMIYWRYGDYVGVGPGAHGRLTIDGQRFATECWSNPAKWLSQSNTRNGEKPRVALTGPEQAAEYLMMGLRIRQGINLDRYEQLAQKPLLQSTIKALADQGFVTQQNRQLIVLNQGFMILNALIRELLP